VDEAGRHGLLLREDDRGRGPPDPAEEGAGSAGGRPALGGGAPVRSGGGTGHLPRARGRERRRARSDGTGEGVGGVGLLRAGKELGCRAARASGEKRRTKI
jgi:hypothetical protein